LVGVLEATGSADLLATIGKNRSHIVGEGTFSLVLSCGLKLHHLFDVQGTNAGIDRVEPPEVGLCVFEGNNEPIVFWDIFGNHFRHYRVGVKTFIPQVPGPFYKDLAVALNDSIVKEIYRLLETGIRSNPLTGSTVAVGWRITYKRKGGIVLTGSYQIDIDLGKGIYYLLEGILQ